MIDREKLEAEITLTSGEYFSNSPVVIATAVDSAIAEYSLLNPIDKATWVTTELGVIEYSLPDDFASVINVYKDRALYLALVSNGYLEVPLGANVTSNIWSTTIYLDLVMDKIEFYRFVDVQPRLINWSIDDVLKKFYVNMVDPYADIETYIIHYNAHYTPSTIPSWHYNHIYKLASAFLLERQALAMSKIVQTAGPGVTATYVNPQVLMTMAKDMKNEVMNALSSIVPERG